MIRQSRPRIVGNPHDSGFILCVRCKKLNTHRDAYGTDRPYPATSPHLPDSVGIVCTRLHPPRAWTQAPPPSRIRTPSASPCLHRRPGGHGAVCAGGCTPPTCLPAPPARMNAGGGGVRIRMRRSTRQRRRMRTGGASVFVNPPGGTGTSMTWGARHHKRRGGAPPSSPSGPPARTQLEGNALGAKITPNITPNSREFYLMLLYSG